jgi:hypothetical protein
MTWAILCVEFGVALTAGTVVMIVIMAGERMRGEAEKKALTLLRPWLSPEQAQQYDSQNHFEVIGSDTGTRYRIRYGFMMNIDQLDSAGNNVCEWCFLPVGNLASGDCMLAQKIALETFEIKALADDMDQAHRTQAWLAVSDDAAAQVTGEYFFHLRRRAPNPQAGDTGLQDQLIAACARISSVCWPA